MALKTSRPARLCVVVMVVACVGGRTADSSESLRRSDDTSGWELVVQGLSQKVEALEVKLQALENSYGRTPPPSPFYSPLHTYIHMHEHTHTQTHTHIYIYTHTHAHVHTHTHIHTPTHTHTQTHTHTHTHAHSFFVLILCSTVSSFFLLSLQSEYSTITELILLRLLSYGMATEQSHITRSVKTTPSTLQKRCLQSQPMGQVRQRHSQVAHLLQLHHFLSLHQNSLNLRVQLPTLLLHPVVLLPEDTQAPLLRQPHKPHIYINHTNHINITNTNLTCTSATQILRQHHSQTHKPCIYLTITNTAHFTLTSTVQNLVLKSQ